MDRSPTFDQQPVDQEPRGEESSNALVSVPYLIAPGTETLRLCEEAGCVIGTVRAQLDKQASDGDLPEECFSWLYLLRHAEFLVDQVEGRMLREENRQRRAAAEEVQHG